MRTHEEQIAGLDRVAQRAMREAHINAWLARPHGDVAFLIAFGPVNPTEIVFASGGFDAWRRGNSGRVEPVKWDLTEDEALEIIVREYREWKEGDHDSDHLG